MTPNEPLTKVVVNLKQSLDSPSITVVKMESVPVSAPQESVYQYINITKNNFNNSQIKNASIEFAVNKSWILAGNFANISLARYENGWSKLKTELTNNTGKQNIYKAYTNAFSYFVIVGEKAVQASQPNNSIAENITQAGIEESGTAANETQQETQPKRQYWQAYAAAVIAVLLVAAIFIAFRRRIARIAYGFLPADGKLLKAQKKRFEAVKADLSKEEREKIKQYLGDGCAHLAKIEMDEKEKKWRLKAE